MTNQLDLNYDVMLGRFLLSQLPPLRPRSIRLFLCAPFDDTLKETNYLFSQVFPKLREFCMSRYGLEFQVVNLNWDVGNRTNLLEECLIEIEKCKSQSIGMTFLSLIGDEYGEPLLPEWIERQNFEFIVKCLKEKKHDTNLVVNSYKLNINYLSNRYELQDDNLNDENKGALFDLIRKGAQLCVENKLLDKSFLNDLNQTIVEKLMKTGAFLNESRQDRVFTFVRLSNNQQNDELANQINPLENLRDKQINFHIPAEQIYRIKVSNSNDDSYIKNFGTHYAKLFENLIDKFIRLNPEYGYDSLYEQVLFHLNFIKLNKINEISPSTQSVIKTLTDYVLDDTQRQPFILTGDIGSGKTSLIATLASNLFLQLAAFDGSNNKHAIAVRFVGIDGKTHYLRTLLKSICSQLQYIKTKSLNELENVPNKLSDLKKFFKKFLTDNFQNENDTNDSSKRKLIIIIDSLQDLSKNDFSYKLDWLPKYLNPMCKLILTVSSESKELIERLTRKYSNPKCYARLENLNQEQGEYMIRKLLSSKNYRLEPNQLESIYNLIKNKPVLPLHLKFLSEEFLNWKSYSPVEDCVLKETLKKTVEYIIQKLEIVFGPFIVKYVLSYLTISLNGFSENELQDILSLDDNLMKEYKTRELIRHNEQVLRMPWLYILNLLNSLTNHFIIKPLHGIYTICWKHAITIQVIKKKYLEDKNFYTHLNKNVAEYYLGLWSSPNIKCLKYEKQIRPKVDPNDPHKLVFDKPVVKMFDLKVNRIIPKQPIQFEGFHTHVKPRYNLRKLSQLPYHLIQANMIKELYENCFFNIEWIYSKINAFDLYSVLNDYDYFSNDPEVNLVCESLKMSESAIVEDPKLLFSQLTGRLLPFYHLYENIKSLIDQSDKKASILNPIIPIGQIFNSPSWIYQDTLDLGVDPRDDIQIDLVESDFNGQILMTKKNTSTMAKFFDIDLSEFKNEIFTGKGKIYCSRNGDFVCMIEENSKLIIRRIESGEFYGSVEFEPCEIGHVYLSSNYACFILRKIPSPMIIDLKSSRLITTLPYQTCFCSISPDEKVLAIHSEKYLNYHFLPSLERIFTLSASEIPEKVVFCRKNTRLFILSRDTKQITCFDLIIDKRHKSSFSVLQDRDIIDMKMSFDESMLLVCSLYCIYVIEFKDQDVNFKFKLTISAIDTHINLTTNLNTENSPSEVHKSLKPKNIFTGYGCTLNNKFIYATMYTYLICYDASTGSILRVFQSTLSANRIIKSFSSTITDTLVSLLDNGKFLLWNLKSIEYKDIKFEDLKIFNEPIEKCFAPKLCHNSIKNTSLCLSYSKNYPDAKASSLKKEFSVNSIIKTCQDDKTDNPLTSLIRLAIIDDHGKFCFIVNDVEEFNGKRLPEEKDFLKKICSVIDMNNDNRVIESFSYVVRKNSRFEICAKFVHYSAAGKSIEETYLIVKQISCINDFDPYCQTNLDWTDFETTIKIFGPIKSLCSKLELYDEFKLAGESLENELCISKEFVYASLMHECNKLYDNKQPGLVKARRFDVQLNLYELFESKEKNLKVQLYNLSEFLPSEEFSNKAIFLDVRAMNNGNLFVVYSKEGSGSAQINRFDYDYKNFRFIRNKPTEKGAFLCDPKTGTLLKRFQNIFSKETNIERILISEGSYAIDEIFNLYELNEGKFLRNIKKNEQKIDLDFKYAKFIFSGRYLVVSSGDRRKLFIVRCYDSGIVAVLRLNDEICCLDIGEQDRTILLGTVNGFVLPLKLVIDLEHNEAINSYIKFYRTLRNDMVDSDYVYIKNDDSDELPIDLDHKETKENLKNDIKRVIQSAHAHRQLKSRESRLSSAQISQNSFISANLSKGSDFHGGVAKVNLTNISTGIKYTGQGTRACIIQ